MEYYPNISVSLFMILTGRSVNGEIYSIAKK